MLQIYGYGSIIWRPDFPYVERKLGYVPGHTRKFWQGSPDHRGTPSAPGRVVTMVPEEGAVCWGMCYVIAPEHEDAVLAYLDHRERGGYVRIDVPFHEAERVVANPKPNGDGVQALTYIASPDNEHFLGPAPLPSMVAQIASAHGESGRNADYVINLANHLRDMGLDDPHVFTLAQAVKDAADGAPAPAALANAAAAVSSSPVSMPIPASAPPASAHHVASSPVATRA